MLEIDRPSFWEQEKLRAAEMTSICNSCCNDLTNITTTNETTGPADSSIQVRPKEVFILVLFFLLLLYSVISFLSQWNKNYREINHLPYYEIYIEKNSELQGMILTRDILLKEIWALQLQLACFQFYYNFLPQKNVEK